MKALLQPWQSQVRTPTRRLLESFRGCVARRASLRARRTFWLKAEGLPRLFEMTIARDSLHGCPHLCRLIKRDRLGFCPINGILVLLPISAADPKNHPEDTAEACRADLTEAFGVLRACPVLVMVPDLERVERFEELIQRLPEAQRGKRMGQRFPWFPI